MTCYHGNCDVHLRLCICYRHLYPFYPFVPVFARQCPHLYLGSIRPSAQHFHNTVISVTSSIGGNLPEPLISRSTTHTVLVVQQHYCTCLPVLYTLRSFTQL